MKTLALFLFATQVPALAAQQPAPAERFALEAGQVQLSEFVDRCARFLGWNVLSDDREVVAAQTPDLRIQKAISVDREGCIDLLSTMLARSGFVLTELDASRDLYEILHQGGPRGRDILGRATRRTPAQILARPTRRMPVTTVVDLQHLNAMVAVNTLRPFFASTGGQATSVTIGTAGSPNAVVLTGLQDQLAMAIGILRDGDVPPPDGSPAADDRLAALEARVATLERKLKAMAKGEER
ncbi:MAG: hypothetical protein KF830_06100 [Planctomycetes bacterium]|nr:hypothetical protein [Planctomycetota bacterium]